MKLMIEISEEDYAETMYRKQHTPTEMDWADRVIANGTPIDPVIGNGFGYEKGYKQGYKDGQDALTKHIELCREEKSVIEDKHISGKVDL